jgi:hypothetical protein
MPLVHTKSAAGGFTGRLRRLAADKAARYAMA